MRVNFYYPFIKKLDYSNIKIEEVIADYEKFKNYLIQKLIQVYSELQIQDPPIPKNFNIVEGKINKTNAKIIIFKKFPLILFEFTFEIEGTNKLKIEIDKIMEEIFNKFDETLVSYLESTGRFEEKSYLNWIGQSPQYFIFEMTKEGEEESKKYITKIANEIISCSFHEVFLNSCYVYKEFFELFCTKSFSILFYELPKTDTQKKYIYITKDTIRDFFIFGEPLLNSVHLTALNSFNQLFDKWSEDELLRWVQYFNDFTELTRILFSNKELMQDPGEKTFGICSQLAALDRSLDNIKLLINLRSEFINKSLAKKTNRLTIIIAILTIVTIVACADDLIENLRNFITWILSFTLYLH